MVRHLPVMLDEMLWNAGEQSMICTPRGEQHMYDRMKKANETGATIRMGSHMALV